MSAVSIGALRIRYSWRGVARSGYPVIEYHGLALFTRHSDGALGLASYHPRRSTTWIWGVSVSNRDPARWSAERRAYRAELWREGNPHAPRPRWWHRFINRDAVRRSQWHDYYRLPLGWSLVVAHQDYHRRKPRATGDGE